MRLGTRGSALALAQAHAVADALGGCEVVVVETSGDVDRAAPDKAKWVDALEGALLRGAVDIAVHSAKDVPARLAPGLALVGCLPREDPRDVLVGALGPRVGTASLRRAAMLRAGFADVEPVELRGNVDTRLRKLDAGEVDGLVLAAAGLARLGLTGPAHPAEGTSMRPVGEWAHVRAPRALDFVPAAGQGVVVLEGRAGLDVGLKDEGAWTALIAERECVRVLGADCHSALGVHFDGATLRAWVGSADGTRVLEDAVDGPDGEGLGRRLLAAGAGELLHG